MAILLEHPILNGRIAQVVEIMKVHRKRRLKYIKEHPECLPEGGNMPEHLSREAEAAAIIAALFGFS